MKFYIRRAIAGVIATPLIAGAYFVGYALLVGAGADPTNTPAGVWANGLMIGTIVAVMFTFLPQVDSILARISGEDK
jgi:hypothetical protein